MSPFNALAVNQINHVIRSDNRLFLRKSGQIIGYFFYALSRAKKSCPLALKNCTL